MKYLFTILSFLMLQPSIAQELEFRSSNRYLLGVNKDRTASISIGDVDGDGDMDAVVANGRHWPLQNQVFFNDGRGIFTVSQPLDITSETSYATELADLDGDGDLDVAVGNDNAPNMLYFNDGKGNFKNINGTKVLIYDGKRANHCLYISVG